MRGKNRSYGFIGLLAYYILGRLIGDPIGNVLGTLRAVTIILVLSIIGGIAYLPHALIGSIFALAFSAGLMQVSVELSGMTRCKFKYMLVSSNVHPLAFMVAVALGESMYTIIQLIVLYTLLAIAVPITFNNIIVLIFTTILVWITGIAFGFYLSSRIQYIVNVFRVTDLVYSILVYMTPVYFPLDIVPPIWRLSILISPPALGATVARKSLGLTIVSNTVAVELMIITLILHTITWVIIALLKSEWREI